jgi:sugar lactone lactonase YvrE
MYATWHRLSFLREPVRSDLRGSLTGTGERGVDTVRHRHRAAVVLVVTAGLTAALVGPASPAAAAAERGLFPSVIQLPNGFAPEGIAIGRLPFAFFGSRVDGRIYRVNLVTGSGTTINPGFGAGSWSLGMKVDDLARLFVAGAQSGDGRVVNAVTGRTIAIYNFTDVAETFVNDVVLTPDAAWFTDSQRPFLYGLPFGRFGRLPDQADVIHLPLSGDIEQSPTRFVNGIARTPDGAALLIVETRSGTLYRVDPATGVTTAVDLGGTALTNGDGLLLDGRRLYVVQNQTNQVSVVELNRAGTHGTVVDEITDAEVGGVFDIPTTVARFGDRLYLPNARFTTPVTPQTPYTAVAVPRP